MEPQIQTATTRRLRSPGQLVATVNDDVNRLERFLDSGANAMIQVAVTVGAVEAVFFVLSPLIALLAVTPIPLIIWGAFYFQRKAGLKGFRTTQTISSTGFRPCSVSRPRQPPNAGGVA